MPSSGNLLKLKTAFVDFPMKFPVWSLISSVLFLTSFSLSLQSAEALPNLVIFLVDDMGEMDTSVPFLTDQGGKPVTYPLNRAYRTPSMERLAAQGTRFSQFYAMSLCSPSRISIMTGQNSARHHSTNWIDPWEDNGGPQSPAWNWKGLKKGDVTLPSLLKKRGYRTLHVGKAHFGPDGSEGAEPLNLGFDVNIAGRAIGAPGSYYGENNYTGKGRRVRMSVPGLEAYHGTHTFLTEALTLEAKKLIEKATVDKVPFFLYMAQYAVHSPFEPDPRFTEHYENSPYAPAWNSFATLIEGMDKSLGDLLDQLNSLGIAKNTLILFLGDNGSDAPLGGAHSVACAAPLRGKKGSHYEGGMRVPFIAAWAESDPENPWQQKLPIAKGAIQTQVADITSLFPTLLGLVDAMPAEGAHVSDGFSLATLLSGERDPSHPEQFLMNYPHAPHRSNYFTTWRNGDWKLIFHALPYIPAMGNVLQSDGVRYQLFNLKEDPFEQTDRAGTEPEIVKRMAKEMLAEMKRMGAQVPHDAKGKEIYPSAD